MLVKAEMPLYPFPSRKRSPVGHNNLVIPLGHFFSHSLQYSGSVSEIITPTLARIMREWCCGVLANCSLPKIVLDVQNTMLSSRCHLFKKIHPRWQELPLYSSTNSAVGKTILAGLRDVWSSTVNILSGSL